MVPDDDRGPFGIPSPAGVPALDEALGSLEFHLADAVDIGSPFTVTGRRAAAHCAGAGIDEVWADSARVVRDLRIRGARALETALTPLGAERRIEVAGVTVTERLVVSRDAPVCWVEWFAPEPIALELTWRVDLADAAGRAGDGVRWREIERGGLATSTATGFRAAYILGGGAGLSVSSRADGDAGPAGQSTGQPAEVAEVKEVVVRARVTVPVDTGVRLVVVGADADADLGRLLRVADRPRVAIRGREAAARRALAERLSVSASASAIGEAVARAVVGHAFAPIPPPGPWAAADAAAEAEDRLAGGDFGVVRGFLMLLARQATDDGRLPLEGDLFLRLLARYLAWSGDRATVRSLWDVAVRVLHADPTAPAGAAGPEGETRAALAVAAEDIGDAETAEALRATAGAAVPLRASAGSPGTGGAVTRVVYDVLGVEPDAPRGRLVLRPRPPGWDRLEVRNLAVGSAAVDVSYRRYGVRHRLTLAQTRGPAPLQVVLEPELPGGRPVDVRVDGAPAELDPEPKDGRWKVPVQIVLDRTRTLEVEFAQDLV